MPKNSIDYSKTIIYKICCKDPTITDIYIGHTTNLIKRRYNHKYSCLDQNNKKYNYYLYKYIRDNGGWENWVLIMIEEYCLNNHNEALQKERYWIEELKATLNKNKPLRDIKEWHEDNKEHEKNYRIQYYQENRNILLEKAKINKQIYYYINREEILDREKTYRDNNKNKISEKNKIYRLKNHEQLKQKSKEKYEKNKSKLLEKIQCECGCIVSRMGLTKHLKTKKHQDFITSQNS